MSNNTGLRGGLARAVALGIAVCALLASTPTEANATLLVSYWTTAMGSGFIAHSSSYVSVNMTLEADITGLPGYPHYWRSANNTTVLEIDTHINACLYQYNYTIETQHTATDPSTSEYDWQSSGDSGNCGP